ncbi:MAG: efflux transporter outer membrane subunit [Sphingomonadales bacterium]|nr:MAG: efflux transporter outer membrane subunit [Sphingomonadales bacterium]
MNLRHAYSSHLVIATLLLGGCAPQVRLAVAPEIMSQDWHVDSTAADMVPSAAQTWTAFGSHDLDQLIEQARQYNTDIAQASARIDQAKAVLGVVRAGNGPVLGASIGAQSNARGGAGENSFRDTFISGEVDISYTLDISGKLRARKRAAFARFSAAGHERDAIRLVVEAQVAELFVQYTSLGQQIALARESLTSAREFERILKLRAREGLTSEVDAVLQASQADAIEVEISRLTERREQTSNALAVLVGKEAPTFRPPQVPLNALAAPRFVPAPPGELIFRRPDLLAAEAMIAAANGDVGEARAAFVPDISLSIGSFVDSATNGGLLKPGLLLAGQVVGMIFDNGSMRNEVYRASAAQVEAVEEYRGALLRALADVQDSLVAQRETTRRVALLENWVLAAQRNAALARDRFMAGSEPYNSVLEAEQRYVDTADALVVARQEALFASIAIFRAMGGAPVSAGPSGSIAEASR